MGRTRGGESEAEKRSLCHGGGWRGDGFKVIALDGCGQKLQHLSLAVERGQGSVAVKIDGFIKEGIAGKSDRRDVGQPQKKGQIENLGSIGQGVHAGEKGLRTMLVAMLHCREQGSQNIVPGSGYGQNIDTVKVAIAGGPKKSPRFLGGGFADRHEKLNTLGVPAASGPMKSL